MKSYLLILILVITINSYAQWVPDSTLNNPICAAVDYQRNPQLTTDGNGGAIIVWEDRRTFSNQYDLYAQLINTDGYIQWASDGIPVSIETDDQAAPQLISDGNGGAIIVWQDNRSGNANIYAQKIDNNGISQWIANGIPICTAASSQFEAKIISDGNDGAIITWGDYRSGFGSDIYAQHVDSSGNTLWTTDGISICLAVNNQSAPQLISDGSDGAIIVWRDKRTDASDIYAQRISNDGTVLWDSNGVVVCSEANEQRLTDLISDGLGGAIFCWYDNRNAVDWNIYAQRIDQNGNKLWTAEGVPVCQETGDQFTPQITSDGNNGMILVWSDYRSGLYSDLYAQRVDASGNVLWILNGVEICTANYIQSDVQLISDESGSAIIVWQDHRRQYEDDIYAQRINSEGDVLWSENGVAISVPDLDQSLPQLIFSSNHNSIIAWEDRRSGNYDIYASKVDSNGYLVGDPVNVSGENKQPNSFELYQNYPNPFNPSTNIEFRISDFGLVTLKVYDILGNEVATLVDGEKPAGNYEVNFDASKLSSGVYFYRLEAGDFVETKKMVLLK